MRQNQAVHIGMVNSYNVLVNDANFEQIVMSGIGFFAHSRDEEDALESIEFMIRYFQDVEMYEKCAKLQQYIVENFNEDGTYKEIMCSCEMPEIEQYSPIPKCSVCNMKISR
jgi:hypothetical protein